MQNIRNALLGRSILLGLARQPDSDFARTYLSVLRTLALDADQRLQPGHLLRQSG
jgi:hypothetical protein